MLNFNDYSAEITELTREINLLNEEDIVRLGIHCVRECIDSLPEKIKQSVKDTFEKAEKDISNAVGFCKLHREETINNTIKACRYSALSIAYSEKEFNINTYVNKLRECIDFVKKLNKPNRSDV